MPKKDKVYLQKPNGQVLVLNIKNHKTTNDFLLSLSQRIDDRLKTMGRNFIPEEVIVPEEVQIKILRELGCFDNGVAKSPIEIKVSINDVRVIIVILKVL